MKSNQTKLIIGWLYPELMNVYGDRGNVLTLIKRAQWRGIKTELKNLNPGFDSKELASCDLIVMGGAQDKQQEIVNKDLKRIKNDLTKSIESGTPGLYVCGGFQFLGKHYKESDGSIIEGLGIFDLYTEAKTGKQRLIGDIVIQPEITGLKNLIVGFENHGGRTYFGKNIKPFGKVIRGFGNNDAKEFEGAVYKNSFGTYLHGPILPKNPGFADHLLKLALKVETLSPLDDELENRAQKTAISKLGIPV